MGYAPIAPDCNGECPVDHADHSETTYPSPNSPSPNSPFVRYLALPKRIRIIYFVQVGQENENKQMKHMRES